MQKAAAARMLSRSDLIIFDTPFQGLVCAKALLPSPREMSETGSASGRFQDARGLAEAPERDGPKPADHLIRQSFGEVPVMIEAASDPMLEETRWAPSMKSSDPFEHLFPKLLRRARRLVRSTSDA